jgi:acetate kinase
MGSFKTSILTINGGSSSIKFALFDAGKSPVRGLHGHIDRIGLSGTKLTFTDSDSHQPSNCALEATDQSSAINFLIDWLEKQPVFGSIQAVGHRVVHGMDHTEPEYVTQQLLNELHRICAYDPSIFPANWR